ncbi:ABC-2 transporter permease [Enterococcus sp. BWM-S5]|uniref:ABC-2 transporter permease n=1 Tax=Enterococcus larvae TaxID=2794352 RepID=A0ABS4CLC1_9ENTE|nr:ABC-2 transporter permease [Enterococcus larvae]MBP1047403.1 ABC-2 transporter permease [Enterococcus larvae]
MISNLLYKELRLAAHPNLYIFTMMGPLLLVPAYPYTMVFLFSCIGNFVNFMYVRETNDIYYTALLPIKKKDVVKSKMLVVVISQLALILISIPFAFLRLLFLSDGNPVGIEANVAYYGFGLMIFAVFNYLFLTGYFKTAYKIGLPFFIGAAAAAVIAVLAEGIVHIPQLAWLDSVKMNDQIKQLPIVILGGILYGLAILIAYKKSVKRFAKVNL